MKIDAEREKINLYQGKAEQKNEECYNMQFKNMTQYQSNDDSII